MSEVFFKNLNKYSNKDTRFGTDKLSYHSYGPLYWKIFQCLPHDACILEIGIAGGYFLKTLADSLPNGQFYGIDINLGNYRFNDDNRIKVFQADASKVLINDRLRYNLIIDDASHLQDEQWSTLQLYWKQLDRKGIYIIEDLYHDETFYNKLKKFCEDNGGAFSLYDYRSHSRIPDDIIIVMQKVKYV